MIRYAFLGVMLVALCAVASETRTASAAPYNQYLDMTFSKTELRCDGDSTWLTIHDVHPNATPGTALYASAPDGGYVGGFAGMKLIGYTNRNNRLTVRVTPGEGIASLGQPGRAEVWVKTYDDRSRGLAQVACPFAPGGNASMQALVYYDDNANGNRDPGERLARGVKLGLNVVGKYPIPTHTLRTDWRGLWTWPSLFFQGNTPISWQICSVSKLQIVSIKEPRFPDNPSLNTNSDQCMRIYLQLGENHFEVGVRRAHDADD